MTINSKALRDVVGLGQAPLNLSDSVVIFIDIQNTYRTGIMQLANVEEAILEAKKLLTIARHHKIPVIHVRHDGGENSPFDINVDIGAFCDEVKPENGEVVITKQFPNSFIQTDLDARLKSIGANKIILAGFMTHMCINSTAHGAFNLGYSVSVVASTTATRALQADKQKIIPADVMQDAAIASTRDLYASIIDCVDDLKV